MSPSMKIALVRHGNAAQHPVDDLRSLSPQGRKEAASLPTFFKHQHFSPKKVIHSELLRAKETATIINEGLTSPTHLEEDKDLRPSSNPEIWLHNLMAMDQDLMIVGHMPYMPLLLELLSRDQFMFPTAGAVILERDDSDESWKILARSF